MSGTEDQPVPVEPVPVEPAAEPVAAELTPPPASPIEPASLAAAPVPAAPLAVKRRRGLGAASFILGLLAILGDLAALVIGLIAVAGALTNFSSVLTDPTGSLGSALGVIVIAAVAVFGGLLFALLAVILGLVAAIRNRGRVLGVFGIIFGLIILIGHVSAIVGIAMTPSNGLTS